jgi:lipopolysaccharide transport system ATP-binding protein
MSSEVCIRAQNVGKAYRIFEKPIDHLKQAILGWHRTYFRTFWAVHDVSFEVLKGEAFGILGRNGSGKSTLLQIIAGTLKPTRGSVSVTGRVAALLELGSGFNPEFTGRENVYLNGAILGLSRSEIDERFDRIAAFADIGGFLDQATKTYSSGMLLRLAFAVQVQVEPDVLIVDEALAVGDALFQKRCFERIDHLRSNGTTLLFVSHDQEAVRSLTTRAMLLDGGKVRANGSPGEVLLEYRRHLHVEETRYYSALIDAHTKSVSVEAPRSEQSATVSGRFDFGEGGAIVEDVEVLGADGARKTLFYPREPVVLHMKCRALQDVGQLNVGLRIRNKEGFKIYSWGTLNQDMRTPVGERWWDRQFTAGESFCVDFMFDCTLGVNLYEVQAYIAWEGRPHFGEQRILHWKDEAAFFQVSQDNRDYFFGGAVDLAMRAVDARSAIWA